MKQYCYAKLEILYFERECLRIASNMAQLQPSSVIICDISRVYISNGVKAMSIEAVVAIINIVISIFGTLANGLVIMAYYRNPRLRTIQNTIFFVLAITDFSVGAFAESTYVAAILDTFSGNRRCVLWDVCLVLSMLFVELSFVTIVILSLQSYITLAHPYQYRTITKSRLVKAIAFSFFLVSFSSLSVVWSRYFLSRVLPAIIILAITIVVLTWCWTYKLVSRHQKAIKTTQTHSPSQKVSRRKILRSTITAFVVIACLLACYFLALFLFLSEAFFNRVVFSDTITRNIWLVAVTSVYLNSLLKPCLVFWRSTSFRETLENILTC